MQNTAQLMDQLFTQSNLPNHSAFARRIGVTRAQMSRYMSGQNVPTDKIVLVIAKACNIDPYELLLKFSWCRTEPEAKAAYEHLFSSLRALPMAAKKFGIIITLGLLLNSPLTSNDAQAAANTHFFEELPRAEYSHNDRINKHYAIIDRILSGAKSYFIKLIGLIARPARMGVLA